MRDFLHIRPQGRARSSARCLPAARSTAWVGRLLPKRRPGLPGVRSSRHGDEDGHKRYEGSDNRYRQRSTLMLGDGELAAPRRLLPHTSSKRIEATENHHGEAEGSKEDERQGHARRIEPKVQRSLASHLCQRSGTMPPSFPHSARPARIIIRDVSGSFDDRAHNLARRRPESAWPCHAHRPTRRCVQCLRTTVAH
jgi:hypothetical protein